MMLSRLRQPKKKMNVINAKSLNAMKQKISVLPCRQVVSKASAILPQYCGK